MMKRIAVVTLALFLPLTAQADRFYLLDDLSGITPSGDGAQARILSKTRGTAVVTFSKNTVDGPVGDLGTTDQMTIDATDNLRTRWLSDPVVTFTLAGSMSLNLWGLESATTANATLTVQVNRVTAAGVFVSTVGSAKRSNPELGTSYTNLAWAIATTATTFDTGDRIEVIVYVDDAVGVNQSSGKTVRLRFNGPNNGVSGDTWIEFTQSVSFATVTMTRTPTVSATHTPAGTSTFTWTRTPTPTITLTATVSATWTPTSSPTFTITQTFTPTPDNFLRRSRLLASNRSVADSSVCAQNPQLTPSVAGYKIVVTSLLGRTTSSTAHNLLVFGTTDCSAVPLASLYGLDTDTIATQSANPLGQSVTVVAYKTSADVTTNDFLDIYGYELDAAGAYVNP